MRIFITKNLDILSKVASYIGPNKKEASLSQKYWIDPSGKEYQVGTALGHLGWVRKYEQIPGNLGVEEVSDRANEMLKNGWTRISSESGGQFSVEVGNLNSIPRYLDNFIAQHFDAKEAEKGIGIEFDDLEGNYAVVTDPFPNIQQQVNKAIRDPITGISVGDSKILSKKDAAFNPYPDDSLKQGPPYAVYIGEQEGFEDLPPVKLYNIFGNSPRFGSTVSEETLKELGIPIRQGKVAQLGSEYDFSSTQFNIPKELSEKVIRWAVEHIPEDQIVHDSKDPGTKGIQLDSHITLKYGLKTNDFEEVKKVLEGEKAPHIKFGKASFFEPEGKDYDVVIIKVESDDLQKLNEKLCSQVEHEDTTGPEYHPHVTVAYVQRGKGAEFDGKDIITDEELDLDKLTFSPKEGEKRELELVKATEKESSFMPSNTDLAPSNDWISETGYPGNSEMDAPENKSDESTWYSPENDRPRTKNFWQKMLSLFQKPLSKKEPKEIVPVKEAEVKKEASDKRAWVDPNGKVFYTEGDIHASWVNDNLEFLEQEYGFKVPKQVWNQRIKYYKLIEQEVENVDLPDIWGIEEAMFDRGWIRIGDVAYDKDIGIELKNLRAIPSFLDNILPQFAMDGQPIVVEDKSKNSVAVTYPFKSLQQVVNKALSSPTKTASSNVFILDSGFGKQAKVLKDPTPDQAANLYESSEIDPELKRKVLRWAADVNGHLYMWDAMKLVHWEAIKQIPADFGSDPNTGILTTVDRAADWARRFQKDWERRRKESPNIVFSNKQASSNVFMLETDSGLQTKALKDPTPEQAINLFNSTRGEVHQLRWFIPIDGHLYMWDAYDLTHWDAIKQIGIPATKLAEDMNTGVVRTEYEAEIIAEEFKEFGIVRTSNKQAKQWTAPTQPVNQPGMDWYWADYIYDYINANWQDLLVGWLELNPKNYVKPIILIEQIYKDEGKVSALAHVEFVNMAGNTDAFIKLGITATITGEQSIEPEGPEFYEHLTDWEIEVLDYGKSDELEKASSINIQQAIQQATNQCLLNLKKDKQDPSIENINRGLCEYWAILVQKMVPGAEVYDGSNLDPDLYGDMSGHLFVEYQGKYYDAEAPQGVDDFHKLPYFMRYEEAATKESSYGPTNYKGPSTPDELYQDSPYRMNVTYSPEEDEELMDQNGKGGYPNRWMSRHRGPYYTNEGKVVKMLEETNSALSKKDINKKALRGPIFIWLSPEGKEFATPQHSHGAWVEENKPMLEKQYGLKTTLVDMTKGLSDVEWLISKGWVRVTGYLPSELDLNVADINNIPEAAERLVWREKPEVVIVEDLHGNDDSFDQEEYAKGLMKKAAISGQTVNTILKLIEQNGGATYNVASNKNLVGTDAYAVAIYPYRELIIGHTLDFDDIEQYLDNNQDLLSNANNSFGAWISGGKTYLDVVATIKDKNQAMELGKRHNQLAIFSLKDLVEIPLQRVASLIRKAERVEIELPKSHLFVNVLINPSPSETMGLLNRSQAKELRYVLSDYDGTLYVWDAYYAGHLEMMKVLRANGYRVSDYDYASIIKNQKDILSIVGNLKQAAAVSDREQQKYYDSVYSERWPDDSAPIDGGNIYYDFAEGGSNDYPNPKDEEKEHVYMDLLEDPAKANFPAGLPEYWVTFYDSQPQTSDEGGI